MAIKVREGTITSPVISNAELPAAGPPSRCRCRRSAWFRRMRRSSFRIAGVFFAVVGQPGSLQYVMDACENLTGGRDIRTAHVKRSETPGGRRRPLRRLVVRELLAFVRRERTRNCLNVHGLVPMKTSPCHRLKLHAFVTCGDWHHLRHIWRYARSIPLVTAGALQSVSRTRRRIESRKS